MTELSILQRVHCPSCGLPVSMPASWDGPDPLESYCNHCYEHVFGNPAAFGCIYLGNDAWSCGHIDNLP